MVCRSEFLLRNEDRNRLGIRPATAVLPNHCNSMLSRLKRLREMTERAVRSNIDNRLAIHNQRRPRFRFPDDFRDASNNPGVGNLEVHFLRLAASYQGESENVADFAGL